MQTAGSGEKMLTAGALAALVFLPVFLLSSIIAGREISRLYALAWSLLAAGTAFAIGYTGRVSFFRRIFFSASALAFLGHFKMPLVTGSAPECFKDAPFCHIAMAPYFLDYLYQQYLALMSGSWKMWGPLTLGALWLFVTLAVGRGWCSWACFYGGIDDGLSALPRRPLVEFGELARKLRDLPAALLIFLMLASLAYMLPVFCLWLCPFKLTGAFLDADSGPRRAQYALMWAALAVLVLGPLLTKKRVFCSYLCPFSAWQAFWGRLNPFRVTAEGGKCNSCLACAAACPMTAIRTGGDGRPEATAYCNLCGQCLAACPTGAMRYTVLGLSLPAGGLAGRLFTAGNFFVFPALTTGAVFSSLWAPAALRDLVRLLARVF
jgi:Fe-S-cluster-containing hydrogenase component 2